jgi:hypothetical protein
LRQSGGRGFIAVILMLLVLPAAAQAAKHTTRVALPPEFYGVNAQAVFDLAPAEQQANLSAMRDGGLSVVRRDALWGRVEPGAPDPQTGAHTYQWDSTDAMVGALAQHGLRWYPILDYTAPWAESIPGNQFSPPARDEDFAAFAGALAHRYGVGGDFWREHPELTAVPVTSYEVWNEENSYQFWQPQAGGAERYADLYMATRATLKSVDPRARVVIGGMVTGNVGAFVRRMYRHRPDLVGNVDAVGFHPYFVAVQDVLDSISGLRDILKSLRAGHVPIDVTEVGWIANSPAEDANRGALLSSLAQRLPAAGLGVAHLIPHTWVAGDTNPYDQWGIYNVDGTPKVTGAAYTRAIQRMESVVRAAAAKPRASTRRSRKRPGPHGGRRVARPATG